MGRLNRWRIALLGALLAMMVSAHAGAGESLSAHWKNLWWTPAQQGQRAFDTGEFETAAKVYQNPMQIGAAYFRAGEFESAVAAFGRVDTPEAQFNRATALLMQGQYKPAIEGYDQLLAARPGWEIAEQNRAIAQARLDKLEPDDLERTEASEIGADDVVFDQNNKGDRQPDNDTVQIEGGVSDQELRARWLKNAQTSPSVFLKAKFSAQLATMAEVEEQP